MSADGLRAHRRGSFRCRRAPGREHRQGHDRVADQAETTHGGRRITGGLHDLLPDAEVPPGPDPAQLHQHPLSPTAGGGLYVWGFEKRGRQLNVRVEGRATFNTSPHIVLAALDGLGVAFLPEGNSRPTWRRAPELARCYKTGARHSRATDLYYPSRKQQSPAFALVIEACRL